MKVDDPTVVRVLLVQILDRQRGRLAELLPRDKDLEIIARVVDAEHAVRTVQRLHPDVVLIDLPSSGARRHAAIEKIMGFAPTPILALVPGTVDQGSAEASQALMAGALDTMRSRNEWSGPELVELRRRIRMLRGIPVIRHLRGRIGQLSSVLNPAVPARRIVGLAASTGGPQALAAILARMAGVDAPVLIVQHIHEQFVPDLASWMARVSSIPVRVATSGESLESNVAYVGPAGKHLRVGAGSAIELTTLPETTHRPSANELFFSLARLGGRAVGVLLTGMGDDGAEGLLAVRNAGGFTIAQDEATSVVYGMPGTAARVGAADRILPLGEIAGAIVTATHRGVP